MSYSKNIIEVSNLSTRYGDITIHENISFCVKEFEIFAILGGSGSGKSTLLRNMLYLQKPYTGEIKFFGIGIWELAESKRKVILDRCSIMFQFGALFSSMSVLDNVGMPLAQKGKFSKLEVEKLALFWIDKVGLPKDSAYKFPHELSGGMKKRASLARALITSPKILFLDEPTSGLDPKSADTFDELILHLREITNTTIIMVTHDLDSIKDSVDRFILLENKHIVFCGSLQELKSSGVKTEIFTGLRGQRALGY
ncbi:MAG: ATP-binding cassette domain-containing protein [Helicobacter sp.]|uniref:ABC transporter ATP-binding protein n=1 Tax=Helicobacter sp. 10-6591 TaxID=2004998 RepID=UPI000DCEBA9F|nr:ATP-binding cassette domain-containing protein [Helicobacter sp. 10-6591]MCI6217832.1 ATP-binding cassette domain-containing protein [Helicobacter sp.]RAX56275.1 ABC transporter ATP-binding protein [Helicobacter sp. 10-6591]